MPIYFAMKKEETAVDKRLKKALLSAMRRAATFLPADVLTALQRAKERETTPVAKEQLGMILRNSEIARRAGLPLCQDTGIQTFFVTAGVESPYLRALRRAIPEAVAEATERVPLRPNTVHPFTGKNPGNNLGRFMPLIEWELVEGGEVTVTLLPKGGGSENMSALRMLLPSAGLIGIKEAVIDHVIAAGGAPCPPTIIGIGIGGGADTALQLAKRALLREVGAPHPEAAVAVLEKELLALVNRTGVGPMGLGGRTTALAVHVEYAMRHPASLPLGIVMQCWADRRGRVFIHPDGRIEVG